MSLALCSARKIALWTTFLSALFPLTWMRHQSSFESSYSIFFLELQKAIYVVTHNLYTSTLKLEAACTSETLVSLDTVTRCNNQRTTLTSILSDLLFSTILDYSWSWALLDEPPILQLLKNFPAFYETWRFITVFTRALHWSLSWARLR
jgi:hypothetical protein